MENAAKALIRALEELDVQQVFGLPGVQNIEIYDALYDSDIRHVLARHEQAAVHMADGYARASGGVGVVFATSGPGATNTVTGIATAYMDSVPLVVITGQVSTDAIGTDAFQEADITTITLPITKHSYLIKDTGELLPAVREAFYIARAGRPGPVLIDVPCNVAARPLAYSPSKAAVRLSSYRPTIQGNARQVRAAAQMIAASNRVLVLAGGGVISSGATPQLQRLVERLRLPVVTTMLAKGALPQAHPLLIGQPGVYGAPAANFALQNAEVVIALGTRFSERVTASAAGFAPRAQILQVDIDPAEIGKNIPVDLPIVGDVATVLEALERQLVKRGVLSDEAASDGAGRDDWLAEIALVTTKYQPSRPSAPRALLHHLNRLLLDRDVIITTDVGQHQIWASHYLSISGPRRFITSGGLGTMGFGLPAAIGAQIARPEATVICVSGDGSFQMNLQEMAQAPVHNLPIKVLLLDNHSHGLVRQWQQLFLEQRYAHTLLDTVPDYMLLAQAFGWKSQTATMTCTKTAPVAIDEHLDKQLRWLLDSPGPALLQVLIPTSCLAEPMVAPGGSLEDLVF
jgi:acetolactate synthase-1/2/3 large subunit